MIASAAIPPSVHTWTVVHMCTEWRSHGQSASPSPTAEMVRQILGAVSQFEKAGLVAKLRHARERKRAAVGRCEGRSPVPANVISEASRLARKSPKTGQRRSLRAIALELARLGHVGPSGGP